MKKKTILFVAFLSTLILILAPCIGSVNANIQNNKNFDIRNINIEDLKNIKERILNSDCNCKETTGHKDSNGLFSGFLCTLLFVIFFNIMMTYIILKNTNTAPNLQQIFSNIALGLLFTAEFFKCDWRELFPYHYYR